MVFYGVLDSSSHSSDELLISFGFCIGFSDVTLPNISRFWKNPTFKRRHVSCGRNP